MQNKGQYTNTTQRNNLKDFVSSIVAQKQTPIFTHGASMLIMSLNSKIFITFLKTNRSNSHFAYGIVAY